MGSQYINFMNNIIIIFFQLSMFFLNSNYLLIVHTAKFINILKNKFPIPLSDFNNFHKFILQILLLLAITAIFCFSFNDKYFSFLDSATG